MRTFFVYNTTWSPGFHIGAARILLMNWVTAAKAGGKLVVACDDLSAPFSRSDASIYELISWLGKDSSFESCKEGPYYNVHSRWAYNAAIETLLSQGWAYYDYATSDEIHQERLACPEGAPFLYSRRFMAHTETDAANYESEGRKPVVRLKMPRTTSETVHMEEYVFPDMLAGQTKYELSQEHDYVIRQANGVHTSFLTCPLNYHLHKVDFVFADWGHRQSLPAQLFIARRLEFSLPQIAHLPFLLEPDGRRRFSDRRQDQHMKEKTFAFLCDHAKRIDSEVPKVLDHGPLSPCYLDFYRRIGFLPATLRHYLLGTAMKDRSWLTLPAPFLDGKHLVDMFKKEDAKSTSTHFDPAALWNMQKRYMEACDVKTKCWLVNDFLRATKMSEYWANCYKDHEPPEELKRLVIGLAPWLVCAGDVLTLSDHFDEALAVRAS
jgi:glutamyl-tRNA synthetase